MADFIDHLEQAKHNLDCAKSFLATRKFHDWAITAAFYSAIHFVEAGFTSESSILHTEMATPSNIGHHTFREQKVRAIFGDRCYRSYRKLHIASQNVRYLQLWQSQTGKALDYYPPAEVKNFVETITADVRKEIQSATRLDLS